MRHTFNAYSLSRIHPRGKEQSVSNNMLIHASDPPASPTTYMELFLLVVTNLEEITKDCRGYQVSASTSFFHVINPLLIIEQLICASWYVTDPRSNRLLPDLSVY